MQHASHIEIPPLSTKKRKAQPATRQKERDVVRRSKLLQPAEVICYTLKVEEIFIAHSADFSAISASPRKVER